MGYPILKIIVPPIYNLWLRKVEGIKNVQKGIPFIIAANHTSYYETLLPYTMLLPILDRQIHALVNSYYWKNPFTRYFINLGKCIPVYVESENDAKEKNRQAFKEALSYLKQGDIIEIFPEGKRSPDGKLQKAYTGAAKLALKAKVPVLPFGVIGSNKVLPKGKIFPRFKRCEVKIGKPMYFEKYYNKKINEEILEEITRKIMKKIAKLIGQKYNY